MNAVRFDRYCGKDVLSGAVKAAEGRYMLLLTPMGKSMKNLLLKLGIAVTASMPLLILWQLFFRFFSFWCLSRRGCCSTKIFAGISL